MDLILDNLSSRLDLFILMFIRVSALIVSSPIFGKKTMPNIVKVCFCLVITYVLFASNMNASPVKYGGFPEFAGLCIKELLFGLAVGFATTLFFTLVEISGHYIDTQMGFGMAGALDVQNGISVPITGNLLNIILLVAFFGVDGHLKLIHILGNTFLQIPAGSVTLNPAIGMTALNIFILAFVLAVNVALPVIAAGLLGEVAMGFITRAVPQVNVFVVGIPVKILLGLMILLIMMPVYVSFTGVIFGRMFDSINAMTTGFS